MGTGYVRNDTPNNIATGNVINASDLDGEFDAIQSAFVAATGHTHDGTAAEGGAVTLVGPAQEYIGDGTAWYPKTDDTYDLGKTGSEWRNLWIDGTANIDSAVLDTADINGGTIDAVTLGLSSPVTEAQIDNININGNTIISTDTNGNINLTPNGTGKVVIDGISHPTADGTSGQFLQTNGAGVLSFVTGVASIPWTAVPSNILPDGDNTRDFGSASFSWKDGFFDGSLRTGTFILGGTTITATGAELNKLAGATPTTAEINRLAGVTSAIQTQIDGKQATDADLTALSALSSTGLVARTAAATYAERTITAGAGISVSNGNGVSGNPTVSASGITTAEIAAATLVTEADDIASNDNDTTIPTSAAVKGYFDGKFREIGPTNTTSGSNIDFTGIPVGVHEIDIIFDLVGLSGTDNILVQLSVSSAFVTSGYTSSSGALASGSNDMSSSTAGFIVSFTNAGGGIVGKMTLNRIPGTNYWVESHTVRGVSTEVGLGAGAISLAGSVDGIRLDTTGTNTFDLGRAFVRWKFLGV